MVYACICPYADPHIHIYMTRCETVQHSDATSYVLWVNIIYVCNCTLKNYFVLRRANNSDFIVRGELLLKGDFLLSFISLDELLTIGWL